MTSYELKKAAIDKLHKTTGKKLPSDATMRQICRAIGRRPSGGLTQAQILRDYLGIKPKRPENIVAPAYRPEFRPMEAAHEDMAGGRFSRLADIQRAQPPVITPKGIGNFKQPGGFMPEVWR